MAACYAVENSLTDPVSGRQFQADPTPRARLIRNIVLGFEFLMSHILHFYILAALDYVQGPGQPFGGNLTGAIPDQSGPWTPDFNLGYYHPGTQRGGANPVPAVWDDIILDYVQAVQIQRKCAEVQGVFGARWPMFSNLVCGGVTHPYLEGQNFTDAIDLAEGLLYKGIPGEATLEGGGVGGLQTGAGTPLAPEDGTILHFIQQHYIPTVQAVAAIYSNYDNTSNIGLQNPDGSWTGVGVPNPGQGFGAGYENFVSYGVFHDDAAELAGDLTQHPGHLLKAGVTVAAGAANPYRYENAMGIVQQDVQEFIDNSWFNDETGNEHPKHAADGYTKPVQDKTDKPAAYSWAKSPRIISDGVDADAAPAGTYACESGPIARMVNSGLYNVGTAGLVGPTSVGIAPFGVCRPNIAGTLAPLLWGPCSAPQNFGLSTMDRHRSRALEALTIANALAGAADGTPWQYTGAGWVADLSALGPGTTVDKSWAPSQSDAAQGWGSDEAPRGSLLHYISYEHNRINRYQCVVPTTWNVNPEADGLHGPIEQAVIDTGISGYESASGRSGGTAQYVAVEVMRVVHSFDPCIGCAVHMVDGKKAKGKRLNIKKEVRGQ